MAAYKTSRERSRIKHTHLIKCGAPNTAATPRNDQRPCPINSRAPMDVALKVCCREVPVTSSRHVAPPLSLHTTIMNILRKLTGTTPTPDAGDKRIREETLSNGEAKKPHKVKQQIQLGALLTSLATTSVLGIGKFPTPRHISTTMSHPEDLSEPTPRLTYQMWCVHLCILHASLLAPAL